MQRPADALPCLQVRPAPDWPAAVDRQYRTFEWVLYRLRRAYLDALHPQRPADDLLSAGKVSLPGPRTQVCCSKAAAGTESDPCPQPRAAELPSAVSAPAHEQDALVFTVAGPGLRRGTLFPCPAVRLALKPPCCAAGLLAEDARYEDNLIDMSACRHWPACLQVCWHLTPILPS